MFTKDELDMFSLCSNSIYCRYAPIRYEINPSFAQQTYRVRQHISNAIGVYRKSREGFISMRDTPLGVSRYSVGFLCIILSVNRLKIRCRMLTPRANKVVWKCFSFVNVAANLASPSDYFLFCLCFCRADRCGSFSPFLFG